MRQCEYCGKELKGYYLQVDRDFFDNQMIFFDSGAFCDKDCFTCSLAECGVIEDKEL
ncbi:hypothetical protein AALT52_00820 [Ligilactobacillus faecis]|uniref:Uncharacterized protein n=1 Tax=Ligilactobacillus faecis TaxID=762833 RepID=A0ABV4DLT2_9LACO